MRESLVRLLRLLALILACIIGWQAFTLLTSAEEGPEMRLVDTAPGSSTESQVEVPVAASDDEGAKKRPQPAFPPRFEIIVTSGILGKAPQAPKPKPLLIGVIGERAMLRAPDGREDLVREGEELGGVKVVKIATNRVLIEFEGKKQELTVYSGMGSPSLLAEEKDQKP